MIKHLVSTLFGSANERVLKGLIKHLRSINHLEEQLLIIGDEEIRRQAFLLRDQVQSVTGKFAKIEDDILHRSFALTREASRRSLGLRHFDVQLLGGMILNQGDIAEMPTGEGKTLAATLPACLGALSGKGVHIVTVNDYLAKRDADWMRPVYTMLGLDVGCVYGGQERDERKSAYASDITYATNNELGFDYLRDNMVLHIEDMVQRDLHFAIVDEVDSILIDEARTPLIISGAAQDSSAAYTIINKLIPSLVLAKQQGDEMEEGDFLLDESQNSVELTEQGHEKVEQMLRDRGLLGAQTDLYDSVNLNLLHYVQCSLRAHHLFAKDVHYMLLNGKVVIVDEHTGRPMPGRRWSNGIHQAVEAKEGLTIQAESQTLASITFQNYFRHYEKLAGMTGTADTEAFEFREIYGLNVVAIPPNKPSKRVDSEDLIYITKAEKIAAIVEEITQRRATGQPILVGTPSIHASEEVAGALTKHKIPFELLNAKQPEREAHVISQAGSPQAVTIATNMAGRGTDIVLGGNIEQQLAVDDSANDANIALQQKWQQDHQQVVDAGGLHIIGTERHESRRIDNQLRGRSGRQGDPGSTCFYLSLEDDLMRIFASDRIRSVMTKLRLPEGEAIKHRMVTNAIERAQRKVETRNFDIRKQLLEYDNVVNEQREVLYHLRYDVLARENNDQLIEGFFRESIEQIVSRFAGVHMPREHWQLDRLHEILAKQFRYERSVQDWFAQHPESTSELFIQEIFTTQFALHNKKREHFPEQTMHQLHREVTLKVIDMNWIAHLRQLDILRSGVHLRGYAQKNPKQEYKREAFELFQNLLARIREDTVKMLLNLEVRSQSEVDAMTQKRRQEAEAIQKSGNFQHKSPESIATSATPSQPTTIRREQPKIGRNQLCYCGSGKKYKHCHGALQ